MRAIEGTTTWVRAAFVAWALLCAGAGPSLSLQDEPGAERTSSPTTAAPVQQGGAAPSDDAFEMGSPPALPEGTTEEEMWPAATADGWRQPCLVRWQRSFQDAVRLARAEQRPILVAVNMDGEIASEHFAGVRYRDPETAELIARYVAVIASVYRHTPRDYDEAGRRVECPRFGTVTCGEHIEAERELYELYFDGKRVSPRHIVLGVGEQESYDVYYSWDTATVFTTFRRGLEGWPPPKPSVEPTLANLVRSADVDDREQVELEYSRGDREQRRAILESLLEVGVVDHVEVLRAALFGFDPELARLARQGLARCASEPALDLIAEALKVPLSPDERALLLDAVARLAETSPRARTLAALHSGIAATSRHLDADVAAELVREYEVSADRSVDVQAQADAALARPNEPAALLGLATALVTRAEEALDRRYARLWLEDARSAAREAERLGASGPKLAAVLALVAAGRGERETARTQAVVAIEGGLLSAGGGAGLDAQPELAERSIARVVRLFAEARRSAIRRAYRAGEEWPPEWVSDVNAAYGILAEGHYLDEATLVEHCDFLAWIGATQRANAVLDEALVRFPDGPALHERLRGRLLFEGGPEALERGYAERLARESGADASQITWFAGYAALVAAEHWRRRGELEAAVAAYDQGSALYERNAELHPAGSDTCSHFIALAHAGSARVALERGELDRAAEALLAALSVRPESAGTQDGLGITPVATAKMLVARLLEVGDAEGAARIQAGLDGLDPSLLEPPPSELPGAQGPGRGGRRSRQ